MFYRCARGRGLHAGVYNLACDIVVNSVILQMYGLKSFLVDREEVMHTAPDGKEGYRYNAEQVYEMLLKKYGKNSEALFRGRGIDRHDLWKEIKNSGRLRAVWDEHLRESGRQWGDTAGLTPGLRQLVDRFRRRSQVDWRQVLHDFIRHDEYDYSFCPPDRRFSDSVFSLRPFIQTKIPVRRLNSGCALTHPLLFPAANSPWRSGRRRMPCAKPACPAAVVSQGC